jgi:hypothetical protein
MVEERTHRTTGINLPGDIWELLNRVAFERAKKFWGRPSVSALLVGFGAATPEGIGEGVGRIKRGGGATFSKPREWTSTPTLITTRTASG